MKSVNRRLILSSVAAALMAGSAPCLANCTQSGATFEIFQCGFGGWFTPPPPGSGSILGVWWQLGYGNSRISSGTGGGSLEGTGIGPSGVFSGNDMGQFRLPFGNFPPGMVLWDARAYVSYRDPQAANLVPPGSLCSWYHNGWGSPGVDGCADNPRSTAAYDNDDILNKFFSGAYSTAYCYDSPAGRSYTLAYQIDYPTAVALRESTGRYFAFTAVTNEPRGDTPQARCYNYFPGWFDLADVINGDLNPVNAKHNVIPWQKVPEPTVTAITSISATQRMVGLEWDNITIHSDGSVRPSSRHLENPGGGVGVLDQGPLCRYVVESAPAASPSSWTKQATIPCPAASGPVAATITIDGDAYLRVRTLLGKTPRTSSTALADVRLGRSGDLGWEATECDDGDCPVSPPIVFIGGVLASERAIDTAAVRERNAVRVTFRTTSELSIRSIDIIGLGQRGPSILRTIDPKGGTTGIGYPYEVTVQSSELKAAKQLQVRLNGPDVTSTPFAIR